MAVSSTSQHISMHYYLNDNAFPVIETGVQTDVWDSTTSLQKSIIAPSSIETVLGIEVPPHMIFLGWYSPDCDLTINMDTETSFDVTNISYAEPFSVYAKWDINTKFKHKNTVLFDFAQGGVNVTPETLAKGVTAYNADGILITGTKEI